MPSGAGLSRFRSRFFLAAALLGGLAGGLAGMSRDQPRTALVLCVVGPVMLFLAGGLGGVAGALLAAARNRLLGRRTEADPATADAAMLLAVFGALLGLAAAVFAGQHPLAHWWTAAGAFAGGAARSVLGRLAAVLLHLAVLDELSDTERSRERAAGGRSRERLLENLRDDPDQGARPPEKR